MDGTTSRNVDGECVKCNSGSFAADNTMTCAACTTVAGALSSATYACTSASDSRISACAEEEEDPTYKVPIRNFIFLPYKLALFLFKIR